MRNGPRRTSSGRPTRHLRCALLAGLAFALALGVACPDRAAGHPTDLSRLQIVLRPDGTRVTLSLSVQDLADLVPAGVETSSPPALAGWAEREAANWLRLRSDGIALSPRSATARASEDGTLVFTVEYPAIPAGVRSLEVRSRLLPELPPAHQQLLSVEDERQAKHAKRGQILAEVTLDRRQFTWPVELPADRGSRADTVSFFRLGAARALTHCSALLCLAALLLASDRLATAGKLFALFVLACSAGSALAALDAVRLPDRVVEWAAAASVVYVTAENLFARRTALRAGGRMLLAPAFGLLHGLNLSRGFTAVPTAQEGAGPLVWFNLGTATVLACTAGVVLPMLILVWRRRGGKHLRLSQMVFGVR